MSKNNHNVMGVFSKGIMRIPLLETFLETPVVLANNKNYSSLTQIVGWGCRPTTQKARQFAQQEQLPYISLEDGFLRSYGTGNQFPPLSLAVDKTGIYYDSTRPSDLETILQSNTALLEGIENEVQQAKQLILQYGLSKYNHAPSLFTSNNKPSNSSEFVDTTNILRSNDTQRILIIDQTVGDMSVELGAASDITFNQMLANARNENPNATIYIKTHPEVSSGRKKGYLSHIQNDDSTVVLRQPINPQSLIQAMDKVYVVSSTMGFEALLANKPVICFGLPWYAGWGVTDDRQKCSRRTQSRSVDELFAAAYFYYCRYLNPMTYKLGTIFDVIRWLIQQKAMMGQLAGSAPRGRMVGIGFRRWKAANIRPLLSLNSKEIYFKSNTQATQKLQLNSNDHVFFWGNKATPDIIDLAQHTGAKLLRMEDGFIRSVGLGSDLIPPFSLVLDSQGIYFDPNKPSDLENILNTKLFSTQELQRAQYIRRFIIEHGITKYNIEPRENTPWGAHSQGVILVPGQVEDDASIEYGGQQFKTNLGLLQEVRLANPNAFIIYKPHPDVLSGNRNGALTLQHAKQYANHIETRLSVVSCIEACDSVHTITSLTGFDALLRGKKVVTYGLPFYAGWGLTDDIYKEHPFLLRRQRQLTLEELIAGVLISYPFYWDPTLKGYTSCEAVLHRIVEIRNVLEKSGELEKLRIGWVRRQWRKLKILTRTWSL